jgi:hypothetical protein
VPVVSTVGGDFRAQIQSCVIGGEVDAHG